MPKFVILNIGLNWNNFHMRSPIHEDKSFVLIPIPEVSECTRTTSYRSLGLGPQVGEENADMPAHNDPDFENFTYGHGERGWGDMGEILSLREGEDHLAFMANLDYVESGVGERPPDINPKWGAYLVGHFKIEHILSDAQFKSASEETRHKFQDNAHMRYENPHADLWIKGGKGSARLKRAIPLSDSICPSRPNEFARKTFFSQYSKTGGWWRWTLACDGELADELLRLLIENDP